MNILAVSQYVACGTGTMTPFRADLWDSTLRRHSVWGSTEEHSCRTWNNCWGSDCINEPVHCDWASSVLSMEKDLRSQFGSNDDDFDGNNPLRSGSLQIGVVQEHFV